MSQRRIGEQLRVLFVDDEPKTRKYFSRAVASHFQVLTADSVESGREVLRQESDSIAVLVVDQRMPRHVGMELLDEARRLWPKIIRILTTAYADLNVAIQAVNEGHIFRYMLKPWDIADLRMQLQQAMEFYLLRRERDALLREKLDVIRRDMVAEQTKRLAILAGGLAHRIRKALIAVSAFLDVTPGRIPVGTDQEVHAHLAEVARRDVQGILRMVRGMIDATLLPTEGFPDQVELQTLLPPVAQRSLGTVQLRLPPVLPALQADAFLVERLFLALLHAARQLAGDLPIQVTGEIGDCRGASGIRVRIFWDCPDSTGTEAAQSFVPFAVLRNGEGDINTDMLTAFFAAYHHRGEIGPIQKQGAAGFDVLLPRVPTAAREPAVDCEAIERVISDLAPWRAID